MHIRIPIKNYLLKYLLSELGMETLELRRISAFEAALSENNKRAMIQKEMSECIFPLLQSRESFSLDEYINDNNYSIVGLKLSENMLAQKRVCLRKKSIVKINDRIYRIMMAELMDRVYQAIDDEARLDNIILGFMAQHSIDEDDIRFDSLKKNCYRERLRIAETLFNKNNIVTAHAVLNLSFTKKIIKP
jgi:hypothetical protein